MTTVSEEPITLSRASIPQHLSEVTREINAGRSVLEPGLMPWSEDTIQSWLEDPSFSGGKYLYFVLYGRDIVGVLPCQRFADDLFLGDIYLRAPMRQPEPLEGMLAALLEQAMGENIRELLVETGYPLSVPPRALHSSGFRYKRTTYFVSRAPLPARILTPESGSITIQVDPTENITGARLRSLYDRLYRPSPSDWPESPSVIEKRLKMAVDQTPILVVCRSTRKEIGYVFGKYDPSRRNFHLEEMGVDQEERGKQLSRLLLAQVIECARDIGAGSLSARVQSDNPIAVHLLRRLSFRTDKRWRVYAATPHKAKRRGTVRLVLDGTKQEELMGTLPPDQGDEDVDLMDDDSTAVLSSLPSARATLHKPKVESTSPMIDVDGSGAGKASARGEKRPGKRSRKAAGSKRSGGEGKLKTSLEGAKPGDASGPVTPRASRTEAVKQAVAAVRAGHKRSANVPARKQAAAGKAGPAGKGAPQKKAAAQAKGPAKKTAVQTKSPAKKTVAKKKPAKKTVAKKKPTKKTVAKKKPTKKTVAKKKPAKKTVAKKKPAKKTVAKKKPTKKTVAKKKPARKTVAKKKPARKTVAKKKPAKKTVAKKKATKKR